MTDSMNKRQDLPDAAPVPGPDARACVANFVAPWVRMAGQYPNHRIAYPGNLAVTLSNTDCAFLNMITLQKPGVSSDALHDDIELARRHASACSGPVMLSVCTDWLPSGGIELITSAGLEPAMAMVGMATDTLSSARREEPALDWRMVEDEITDSIWASSTPKPTGWTRPSWRSQPSSTNGRRGPLPWSVTKAVWQ